MSKKEAFNRAVMQMLYKGTTDYGGKRFYGYLLSSCRKFFDQYNVPTAGVNITDQINLYVNLDWFNSLESDLQRIQVLEHEMKHLINFHQKRLKALHSENDHKLWNIACDIAINEPLTSLHEFGCTAEKFRELIPDIKNNETAEYYFQKLKEYREENQDGQDQIEGQGEPHDDHSTWSKSEDLTGDNEAASGKQLDQLNEQVLKKAMKDAIEQCDGRGNVPQDVLRLYDKLGVASVNWRQHLKAFIARADKFNKEPTRKKRNRRYGTLVAGKRKKPHTHIAICLDESGSVGDDYHKQFFNEIKSIYETSQIRITLIHADCEVKLVEDYDPKKEVRRVACGGTMYMPAIEKAEELKVDGIIYFGDGDIFGEKLRKPNLPFLWAMEEGRDAPAQWGKVCHVKLTQRGTNEY
jgi:predicted metal-dependent peptidase